MVFRKGIEIVEPLYVVSWSAEIEEV